MIVIATVVLPSLIAVWLVLLQRRGKQVLQETAPAGRHGSTLCSITATAR